MADDDYAVIYITEQAAQTVKEEIQKYRSKRFPAIILIPGSQGSLGLGMRAVKESVEKAVGADILFND